MTGFFGKNWLTYNSVNMYALCIGTFDYDFGNLRKLVLSIVCTLVYLPALLLEVVVEAAVIWGCNFSDGGFCWPLTTGNCVK